MKRVFVFLFLCLVLFLPGLVYGAEFKDENSKNTVSVDVSAKLKKEIKDAIVEIYGKDQADNIFNMVLSTAQKAISERPKELLEQDYKRNFRL